jgi:hypothetical protein
VLPFEQTTAEMHRAAYEVRKIAVQSEVQSSCGKSLPSKQQRGSLCKASGRRSIDIRRTYLREMVAFVLSLRIDGGQETISVVPAGVIEDRLHSGWRI